MYRVQYQPKNPLGWGGECWLVWRLCATDAPRIVASASTEHLAWRIVDVCLSRGE